MVRSWDNLTLAVAPEPKEQFVRKQMLDSHFGSCFPEDEFIGASSAFSSMLEMIHTIAARRCSVIITGETGYDPNCDISLPADDFVDEYDLNIFTDNWLNKQ